MHTFNSALDRNSIIPVLDAHVLPAQTPQTTRGMKLATTVQAPYFRLKTLNL